MRPANTTPTRRLRSVLLVFALLVILAIAYLGWNHWRQRERLAAPIPASLLDIAPIRLARPDAMIISTRLADLPRDMLNVPLLKSVLTEDFVFYYEDNASLLGLKGTLRRIAYEHKLSLGDEAIALALQQPADVALWHDSNGRLTHWLINAQRSDWSRFLQLAAQVALSDSQLTQVGTVPLLDGTATPVYQLTYAPNRVLLFAGNGDKMVVFSDPQMLTGDSYGADSDRNKVWQALLDSHWQASPLRRHFGLAEFKGRHTVVAETAFLSFNYQQFFPAFEALRFDFDGQRWASYVRLNGGTQHAALETAELWAHLPGAASLCSALPLEADRLAPIFKSDGPVPALANTHLLDGLKAPAAVCWYADAGLYSPLVVAHLTAAGTSDAALDALFKTAIGNSLAASSAATDAAVDHGQAAAAAPTEIHMQGGARVWHRSVATDFGRFDVTMARQGDWLAFSPKAQLVEDALAVDNHVRPALADSLPSERSMVPVVINPRTLASLLEQAALGSLPQRSEPILRAAAQNLLTPRLKALSEFAPVALMLPQPLADTARAWQPIQWQAISDAR